MPRVPTRTLASSNFNEGRAGFKWEVSNGPIEIRLIDGAAPPSVNAGTGRKPPEKAAAATIGRPTFFGTHLFDREIATAPGAMRHVTSAALLLQLRQIGRFVALPVGDRLGGIPSGF